MDGTEAAGAFVADRDHLRPPPGHSVLCVQIGGNFSVRLATGSPPVQDAKPFGPGPACFGFDRGVTDTRRLVSAKQGCRCTPPREWTCHEWTSRRDLNPEPRAPASFVEIATDGLIQFRSRSGHVGSRPGLRKISRRLEGHFSRNCTANSPRMGRIARFAQADASSHSEEGQCALGKQNIGQERPGGGSQSGTVISIRERSLEGIGNRVESETRDLGLRRR